MAQWVVSLLAAVVAATFAGFVLPKVAKRKRSSDAAWAVGLILYALASLIEAASGLNGWTPLVYRLYFPLAAGLVGFLGLGTLYLAGDRRLATGFAGLLLAAFTFMAISAALAPLPAELTVEDPGLGLITGAPRTTAVIVNIVGGLLLIVGPLIGWLRSGRTNIGLPLISLGALLPFTGGSLSSLGIPDARVWAQLVGISVMFAGYWMSRQSGRG